MKIHNDIEQGSLDWELLRLGKVTASEADALVSPLGKVKTGEGPRTFLLKKLAEEWSGQSNQDANAWNLDQGRFLEEFARPAFTLETGLEVETVGFIESDDGRVGCSPDGLLDGRVGLEIKCPHLPTQIGYLLDGKLPADYIVQIQFSLFVTGFSKWIFYSFRRKMPSLRLEIQPDPKMQESIKIALESFMEQYDAAKERLTKINGGWPVRRQIMPKPEQEPIGITP